MSLSSWILIPLALIGFLVSTYICFSLLLTFYRAIKEDINIAIMFFAIAGFVSFSLALLTVVTVRLN